MHQLDESADVYEVEGLAVFGGEEVEVVRGFRAGEQVVYVEGIGVGGERAWRAGRAGWWGVGEI